MEGSARIHLLAPEIIHRIAAGEVVDRPASVIKELVENSIDAGATRIRVTLVEGGIRLMEVEDNGCGMSKADLEVCVQRHATSKISKIDDLDYILSLGFRGEALSAVSSVSQLSIETAQGGKSWIFQTSGNVRSEIKPTSRSVGTIIRVQDLFFNAPARRKFLKKPGQEAHECVEVLRFIALSHPQIAFSWHVVDESGEVVEMLDLPQSTDVERFRRLNNVETNIIEIREESVDSVIQKLVILAAAPPTASRNQKAIRLVVNGRSVFDKQLPFSIREAYLGLIEVGHYPTVLVQLEVNPSQIDVNIHPQKKEIRWPTGFSLAGLVYRKLRPKFEIKSSPAVISAPADSIGFFQGAESAVVHESKPFTPFVPRQVSHMPAPTPIWQRPVLKTQMVNDYQETQPAFDFRQLKVVGEVGASWIVAESPQGLVLIDQHAAHERVQFERFLSSENLIRSKPLLVPIELEIPLLAHGTEVELAKTLERLGFEIDKDALPAKKNILTLIAVPEADRNINWKELLTEIFDEVELQVDSSAILSKVRTKLAASLACHWSVRRGQRLTLDEIRELLSSLATVNWGGFCPHGRPLWQLLSHSQIEMMFHR